MKRAVSVSIGSSKRDKAVEVELFGETVRLERIGTDGDMEAAARMYTELDGQVDAFGVGGALLGLMVGDQWYTMRSVQMLIQGVKKTPVVDGTGLKMTLERRAAGVVERELGSYLTTRRAFSMSGLDRYGLTRGFFDAGYEMVLGDLMFTLGLSIPIHTEKSLKNLTDLLLPVVGRLPFSWIYPTGESQEKHTPKFTRYFEWASVLAGDCHYITKYMPDHLEGRVVVTNTTTEQDREQFKNAGIRYLVTTTPVYDGRSFGTNMMEAALVAALGRTQAVDYAHPGDYFQVMENAIDELKLSPQLQEL